MNFKEKISGAHGTHENEGARHTLPGAGDTGRGTASLIKGVPKRRSLVILGMSTALR